MVRFARPSWLRSRAWAAAAVAGAIAALGTLSVAPKVWFRILPYLRPHVTLWFIGAGLLFALGLYAWTWSAGRAHRAAAVAAVTTALGLYILLLFVYYRGEPPAKKFHLFEYAVLGGLALEAVRVDAGDRRGLSVAALFLFVVGTADESAQAFIPMRTFRFTDMLANWIGAALGAVAWLAASPHSPWRRQAP